jgi:hypothetical protein
LDVVADPRFTDTSLSIARMHVGCRTCPHPELRGMERLHGTLRPGLPDGRRLPHDRIGYPRLQLPHCADPGSLLAHLHPLPLCRADKSLHLHHRPPSSPSPTSRSLVPSTWRPWQPSTRTTAAVSPTQGRLAVRSATMSASTGPSAPRIPTLPRRS